MRLDKFLSSCGYGTRKQVNDLIKEKRIIVNDTIINKINHNVNEKNDIVYIDGNKIHYQEYYYYLHQLTPKKNFLYQVSKKDVIQTLFSQLFNP